MRVAFFADGEPVNGSPPGAPAGAGRATTGPCRGLDASPICHHLPSKQPLRGAVCRSEPLSAPRRGSHHRPRPKSTARTTRNRIAPNTNNHLSLPVEITHKTTITAGPARASAINLMSSGLMFSMLSPVRHNPAAVNKSPRDMLFNRARNYAQQCKPHFVTITRWQFNHDQPCASPRIVVHPRIQRVTCPRVAVPAVTLFDVVRVVRRAPTLRARDRWPPLTHAASAHPSRFHCLSNLRENFETSHGV